MLTLLSSQECRCWHAAVYHAPERGRLPKAIKLDVNHPLLQLALVGAPSFVV